MATFTRDQLESARSRIIPDVIDPHLNVLFCGINPGLYSAASGYHFGRPGNRFWKALHLGGFTDHLYHPSQQRDLLKLGYGITNVVSRPTAAASELSPDEFVAGGIQLIKRLEEYQPTWLAILGIEAYRRAFGKPDAVIGEQLDSIGSTRVWVLPSPSGLNAHYTAESLGMLFADLRKASTP